MHQVTRAADRRVVRTRALLQQALLELGAATPFTAISVADLTAVAGVSRSTFYDHYPDVEALLLQTLEAGATDEPEAPGAAPAAADSTASDTTKDGPPAELVRFLEHVEQHHVLYRSALGAHGSMVALHSVRARIERAIAGRMHEVDFDPRLPEQVTAAAVSGLVIGLLLQWLETEPLPSAQVEIQRIWWAVPRPRAAGVGRP